MSIGGGAVPPGQQSDFTPDVVICHEPTGDPRLLRSALWDHGITSAATASVDLTARRCDEVLPRPVLVVEGDRVGRLSDLLPHDVQRRPFALALIEDDSPAVTLNAFRAGADAVLTSPFDSAVFVAQARALLQHDPARSRTLWFGGFTLHLGPDVVMRDGEEVHLTPTEFDLLSRLVRAGEGTVSTSELRRAVWRGGYVAPDTLHVHLSALRRKLHRFEPGLMETRRGRGYRLRPAEPQSRSLTSASTASATASFGSPSA